MRHQIGEGEEARKEHKKVADGRRAGSKQANALRDVLMDEKIDPAHFFDPEEFGTNRRNSKPSHP